MTIIPRAVVRGRRIAGVLLLVVVLAVLTAVIALVAWELTRPPTV